MPMSRNRAHPQSFALRLDSLCASSVAIRVSFRMFHLGVVDTHSSSRILPVENIDLRSIQLTPRHFSGIENIRLVLRAKISQTMEFSSILSTGVRVILPGPIDRFSRSTVIEERLKTNAMRRFNVHLIIVVGKRDSIFHQDESDEKKSDFEQWTHLFS